jgi:Family of unknown function (DUF6510)
MDQNQGDALPLDGNAAAGLLRELFAIDMTEASVTCDGCGTVAEIGEERLYGGTMGVILCCRRCNSVIIRLVRTPNGLWLDMRGSQRVFIRAQR